MTIEQKEKICKLTDEFDRLMCDKRNHEVQMQKIKMQLRMSGMMEKEKYRSICESQVRHLEGIAVIEKKMSFIKSEKRKLSIEGSIICTLHDKCIVTYDCEECPMCMLMKKFKLVT